MEINKNIELTKALEDELGGGAVLARLLNISPQAVSAWKKKKGIPRHWLMYLKAILPKLKAWDLLKDKESKEKNHDQC